jgi:hypothetical protein
MQQGDTTPPEATNIGAAERTRLAIAIVEHVAEFNDLIEARRDSSGGLVFRWSSERELRKTMSSPTVWLQEVYEELGRLLEQPESFGVGQHAPEPLASAVMAMRDKLKKAILELSQNGSDGDLSTELSEDAA